MLITEQNDLREQYGPIILEWWVTQDEDTNIYAYKHEKKIVCSECGHRRVSVTIIYEYEDETFEIYDHYYREDI